MDNTGFFGDLGYSKLDEFLTYLSATGIIDVGRIRAFRPSDGTADVALYSGLNGARRIVSNVEVVYIGNNANGITGTIVGSPCLVFIPRSVVVSLKNGLVDTSKKEFNVVGAKCLPLSTAADIALHVGFNPTGDFVLQSDKFVLTISDTDITYTNRENTLQYNLNYEKGFVNNEGGGKIHTETKEDGNVWVYYENTEGKVAYCMHYAPDGTYTISRNAYTAWDEAAKDDHSQFTDYMWIETFGADGSYTKVLKDADSNVLNTTTRNADSSQQIVQTASNGDVLNNITISSDGNITISQTKAQNTITLKQDGTLSIATHSDITVNATGNATLMAGSGKKLKAGGNGKSLKDILITDLLGLLAAFDTAGSPASHTTGPNASLKIQQFQTDWAAILD